MTFDLVIRNGAIVDGSGRPSFVGDVAVTDGKIVAVGRAEGEAKQTIDATGLAVSPGFIDHHTHYDAQICWDSMITPSSWHGVTTVLMGNCGVGLAPCKPESREIATQDLVNIEAIPYDVLQAGLTWDWVSFPSYMDAAERRGSAVNLGFMAPLTPFRHWVMGEQSMERAANPAETAQIAEMLSEAVESGAFGFSSSVIGVHIGYNGVPLACRKASRDELAAYCKVLRRLGHGTIQLALTDTVSVLTDDEYELLDMLLTESGRPVTWLALFDRDDKPSACQDSLTKAEPLIARGGMPQVSVRPLINEINLKAPLAMANMQTWAPAFNKPKGEQKKLYADPGFRGSFREELKAPRVFNGDWKRLLVRKVADPKLRPYEGRTIADIARDRGVDGVDAFLDFALEDDLETEFVIELFNTDEQRVAKLLTDPRALIGLSDGGAHVDMLCDAGYASYLLGTWVRDKQIMPLETAIKRITSEVADFFGIKTRGRIVEGQVADLAIFDPATVGSPRHPHQLHDFPADGLRLVTTPTGVHYTIVSGEVVYDHQQATGALPGRVLRSGSC